MTAQARLLGGRYQVGELLGYGGMAEVHKGRDLRLGPRRAPATALGVRARPPGPRALGRALEAVVNPTLRGR